MWTSTINWLSRWGTLVFQISQAVLWIATAIIFTYFDKRRAKYNKKYKELWDQLLAAYDKEQKYILECDDTRKTLLEITNTTINDLCPSCIKKTGQSIEKLVKEHNDRRPDGSNTTKILMEIKYGNGVGFERGPADDFIENLRKLNNTPAADDEWPDTL